MDGRLEEGMGDLISVENIQANFYYCFHTSLFTACVCSCVSTTHREITRVCVRVHAVGW